MHSKIHLLVVGLEQLVVGLDFDFDFGFGFDLAEVVVVDFVVVVVVLIVVLKDEKQVDLVGKEVQLFLHEIGLIP